MSSTIPEAITSLVNEFASESRHSAFSALPRQQIALELMERIANPGSIGQGTSSLCGPAAFFYCLAKDSPEKYVQCVIDLYDTGVAMVGHLKLAPGPACRGAAPDHHAIAAIDWLTLASLRDSENVLLDYSGVNCKAAGITLPGQLASWFRKAGYRHVENMTSVWRSVNQSGFDDLLAKNAGKFHVCLFVNSTMCKDPLYQNVYRYAGLYSIRGLFGRLKNLLRGRQRSLIPNHWVVVSKALDKTHSSSFAIYNWGNGRQAIGTGADGDFSWLYGHLFGGLSVRRLTRPAD